MDMIQAVIFAPYVTLGGTEDSYSLKNVIFQNVVEDNIFTDNEFELLTGSSTQFHTGEYLMQYQH